MSLTDKPTQVITYLRKLRLSLGPDSYFRYKRDRKYEHKDAERARARVQAVAREDEQAARDAARERDYHDRYVHETAEEQRETP